MQQYPATHWTTPMGTISQGMPVLMPDGESIGRVDRVDGNKLRLFATDSTSDAGFVLLSEVDGVSDKAVLLQDRGDDVFGIGS